MARPSYAKALRPKSSYRRTKTKHTVRPEVRVDVSIERITNVLSADGLQA